MHVRTTRTLYAPGGPRPRGHNKKMGGKIFRGNLADVENRKIFRGNWADVEKRF